MANVSKDVFRCILEYQFPNELTWRYSETCTHFQGQQSGEERHFPAVNKLDYENYLVEINDSYPGYFQFNLRDGTNCGSNGSGKTWARYEVK